MSTAAPRPARRRRLLWLASAGVIVIVIAIAYIKLWLERPIGSGPAGPTVAREPFEQTWTDRPVLILGVGDSITAGLGAKTPEHSYFRRVIENPTDEFPELDGVCLSAVLPNLQSLNLAISGSTSLDHLHVLQDRFPAQKPEVLGIVFMTTGGNDLIHSYGRMPPREGAMYGATLAQAQPWIDNYQQRLHDMLDLLNERFPGGCHIFLADIYDPTDGVGDAPRVYLPAWPDGLRIHAAYNEIIHQVADERENVHLVPLHANFLGHGSHCRQFWRANYQADDPYYWFYENIEDPNDRGYDAIRRLYLNAMIPIAPQLAGAKKQRSEQ